MKSWAGYLDHVQVAATWQQYFKSRNSIDPAHCFGLFDETNHR